MQICNLIMRLIILTLILQKKKSNKLMEHALAKML